MECERSWNGMLIWLSDLVSKDSLLHETSRIKPLTYDYNPNRNVSINWSQYLLAFFSLLQDCVLFIFRITPSTLNVAILLMRENTGDVFLPSPSNVYPLSLPIFSLLAPPSTSLPPPFPFSLPFFSLDFSSPPTCFLLSLHICPSLPPLHPHV